MSVHEYPAWSRDWSAPSAQDAPTDQFPVTVVPKKWGWGKKALVVVGVLYAIFTAINIQFMTDDYPECRSPGSIMPSTSQDQ